MEGLLEEEKCAPLQRGEIRRGEVLDIWAEHVIVDLQSKREGFVPKTDIDKLEKEVRKRIAIGATFPVYVVQPEDREGRTIVSITRGLVQEDWDRANELLESEEVWEGEVIGYNRGGLLVSFGRIRGFVPASQVVGFPPRLSPEEKEQHSQAKVGQTLGLRVIEVEQRRNRLVLSERRAQQAWRRERMKRLLEELEEGQIVKGRVTHIQDYGAFVDLGQGEGLVHISEMAWGRVEDPRDVVQVGEEVRVQVLRIDHERQRVALSLRQVGGNPWDKVEENYALGQVVKGRLSRLIHFGAFAVLEDGIEGLVHISELDNGPVGHPEDVVEKGQVLPLKVIRIDPGRQRIGLSLRRVSAEEWADWRAQHPEVGGGDESAADEPEIVVAEVEPDQAESDAGEPDGLAVAVAEVEPDQMGSDAGESDEPEIAVAEVEPDQTESDAGEPDGLAVVVAEVEPDQTESDADEPDEPEIAVAEVEPTSFVDEVGDEGEPEPPVIAGGEDSEPDPPKGEASAGEADLPKDEVSESETDESKGEIGESKADQSDDEGGGESDPE
jgi:small subunit ribosomal protein S1